MFINIFVIKPTIGRPIYVPHIFTFSHFHKITTSFVFIYSYFFERTFDDANLHLNTNNSILALKRKLINTML